LLDALPIMHENPIIITGTYSLMTKALFAIGIPMFAVLAVFCYWSALFDSARTSQSLTFFMLGSFHVWLFVVSLKLVRFLRCRILIDDQGIRLRWPSEEHNYSWPRLGAYRDRQALQLVEVYDCDGNRVLVFDYYLTGFGEVYSAIADRLPTRT